jgi:hypothetical protein
MTSRIRIALAALALMVAAAAPAHAQFTFGDQRVGTSSGTFLRIGLGARAVGLGEAFVAVANDPSAIYWNPAGLASLQRSEILLTHVEWPADIRYEHIVYVMPVRKFGGSLGFQFGVLATEIDETTELNPFGTGRSFFYSDLVAGISYARRWTDKLLVGGGVKYVHEDLGTDVGGPSTQAFLIDIGSIYYLGYGSVRIATALSNFGSEMRPSDPNTGNGQWVSPITGEQRTYDGFDPPLMCPLRTGVRADRAHQSACHRVDRGEPAGRRLAGAEARRRMVVAAAARAAHGLQLQRRRAQVLGRRRPLCRHWLDQSDGRLRVHRRRQSRLDPPHVAGGTVLMRARSAIGPVLLVGAIVLQAGCGAKFPLPTESDSARESRPTARTRWSRPGAVGTASAICCSRRATAPSCSR